MRLDAGDEADRRPSPQRCYTRPSARNAAHAASACWTHSSTTSACSVAVRFAPAGCRFSAAWAGASFFIASKDRARKTRNLEAEARCVISADTGDLHVIVEGVASHVRDEAGLQRAVDAFQAVYGWPTRIQGSQLDADYGAPTSGGAPFEVYEVTPVKAFGFPTDGESMTPTRWTWPP